VAEYFFGKKKPPKPLLAGGFRAFQDGVFNTFVDLVGKDAAGGFSFVF